MNAPRVASLLPAATELVCEVGGGAQLVGVSHECDFPDSVRGLPVLTSTRLHAPPDLSSAALDAAVRALVRDAASLYQVDDAALASRIFGSLRDEHDRARAAVLEIVEARELLDRHPVLQQSIRLRNPYVDPMNAIQVELLKRWRAGDEASLRPLLRSIAGVAAALRNTG